MSTTTTFGQWLKQRRKALGLTQKDLARQAGCAEITLRKIEAGDLQPSAPLVASLARVLGVADAGLPGLLSLARGADDNFSTRARLLRPQRANNLPAQLTPLIGRERDITAVRKRLLSDGARLITLVGPPGVGKTRLAQAVAEDVLEHFEHGAFFVRLAPIGDPTLVASAIAQALDLQMSGATPPALQLRAYLEEKHLLLMLDNFEHLVEAASLVDDLLRRCPWLHVLVTSRQPLRVRGERQIPVQPLALPVAQPGASRLTGDDALHYSAVALFADRAEAVQHDFVVDDGNAAAVAELCRRLDGLPLAIELVAARVKLLPPAELLTRLRGPWLLSADGPRNIPARQQTLRGAISWSYGLLVPEEQTFFTYLAVFVGGCTLEAAEMLCRDTPSPSGVGSFSSAQVFEGIDSLLDKSLLHRADVHGEPRYIMLETVREYALERLSLSGQEALLRARHARCFLRIIENADQADLEPSRAQLLRRIDDDIHNVRAALDWAIDHDVQAAVLLAAALLDWLYVRGLLEEGTNLIARVFALPSASTYTIPGANARLKAGMLMILGDETSKAQAYVEESLTLSRDLGHGTGEAAALFVLGQIAYLRNELDAAIRFYESSLERYKKLDDPAGVAQVLPRLVEIALCRADFLRAGVLAEEGFAVAQQAGFRSPNALWALGNIAYYQGDLDRARSQFEQALAMEDTGLYIHTLTQLASIATRQGEFTAAHGLLAQSLERAQHLGRVNNRHLCWCYLHLAILAQEEGDYGNAVRWYRAGLPGTKYFRDNWCVCGLSLARLAMAVDYPELAARLLGATIATDVADFRLLPIDHDDYDRLAEAALRVLGATRFDAAWTLGQELEFEQVVEAAVSILEKVVAAHDELPEL